MADQGAGPGGVAIGAGLVAMWITFAVTSSTGWAWAVFFVVGGMVFTSASATR